MASKRYDMIIIGGGIHGAAVARQAVERGLEVLLLEQFDEPAPATSRRSSKLIHGGLRYLESFSFGLVRECLLDRRRLLQDYSELVSMQKFYIPIYQSTSRSRLELRAGLSLYGVLGGLDQYSRFHTVPKSQWHTLDGIKQEGLLAVFQYWDGQTDDQKLTARLLEETEQQGACIQFGAEFLHCQQHEDQLSIRYQVGEEQHQVNSRYLINASGPWVNQVLAKCSPAPPTLPVDLVQGTHLELPGQLDQGIYYLEAPQDQRAIFAMPWYDRILFGTTEKVYTGDPAKVAASQEEIDYLLQVYNHYFADKPLQQDDIITAWAGLRVLPASDENPFGRSRDTILKGNREQQPNIISIYGGKLTSHYSTAIKVLKYIQ